MESILKFVLRVFDYFDKIKFGKTSRKVESKINKAIRDVEKDIEYLKYNLAVIKIRQLFDSLEEEISRVDFEKFLKIFSLFCPHVAEEMWEKIGNKDFISLQKWPVYDEKKIDDSFDKIDEAMDKVVGDCLNLLKIVREKSGKEPNKIYLYVLPNESKFYDLSILNKRIGKEVFIYAVNDKNKYDPDGKSAKAKPFKPGIYLE